MVKYFIVSIIIIIITNSCSESKVKNDTCLTYCSINNNILKEEIVKYAKEENIFGKKNVIVCLQVCQFEDTTVYKIGFIRSASAVIFIHSVLFCKIEQLLVAISFEGVNDIILEEKKTMEYLKSIFEDEYAYYIENNDFPPPTTGRTNIWELSFRNNKLIKKTIIKG